MEKDTVIRSGTNRPLQRRHVTHGWTGARRAAFLDEVASSCNLKQSVAAVGMTHTSLYALRRRDAVFAEQLRNAMLVGYERLEAELLRMATAAFDDGDTGGTGGDGVLSGMMTVEQAMRLLDRYQSTTKGAGVARREGQHRATQAETDAMLLEQLRILKRQQDKQV